MMASKMKTNAALLSNPNSNFEICNTVLTVLSDADKAQMPSVKFMVI